MVEICIFFFIEFKTKDKFKFKVWFEVNTIIGSRGIFFGGVKPYKEKHLGGPTYDIVKTVIVTLD